MRMCTSACLPVHIAAALLRAAASLVPWLRDMKWFERADDMYLDFSACRSVLNTPIPFAVRGRAALSNGGGGSGAQMVDECAATHSAPLNMSSLLSLV